jgi:hypothetical protein
VEPDEGLITHFEIDYQAGVVTTALLLGLLRPMS